MEFFLSESKHMVESSFSFQDLAGIQVGSRIVKCEREGHPVVYLNMGDQDHIDCPYCRQRFVLIDGQQEDRGIFKRSLS